MAALACSNDRNRKIIEISPILKQYESKSQQEEIERFYQSHKALFWKTMLGDDEMRYDTLNLLMRSNGIPAATIEKSIPVFKEFSETHKTTTLRRDSIFREGIECLQKLHGNELLQFESDISAMAKEVLPILETDLKKQLIVFLRGQLNWVEKRKERLQREQEMMFGEIGKNITAYNELSFETIMKVHCTEYDPHTKRKIYELTNKIFANNAQLKPYFKAYKKKEEQVVNLISSAECKKRKGILRHYDELNDAQIRRTQKANMLLNIIKYYNYL